MTQNTSARKCVQRMFARDFAARVGLSGTESADADVTTLRSMSVAARRAIYEHAVQTCLDTVNNGTDDVVLHTLGVDPIVALRLLKYLRRKLREGPDGLEG